MRGARIIRVIIVNGAVLVAGLLLLEIGFGNWLRPNRMNRLNMLRDATITYDASALYPTGGKPITYSRDTYGLRGRYRDPASIDILTIGGSATDQRYISDGDTWQDVLSSAFAEDGKAISVVNAGVDGQSTVGHIKNFDWWFPFVPGLKPRFDLFYLGVNDFFLPAAYDDFVKAPTVLTRVRESSALYALFAKMRGAYLAVFVTPIAHRRVDFASEGWTDRPLLNDHAAVMREPVERYRHRLRMLLAKSAAMGARPICVTQDARYYREGATGISGVSRRMTFEAHEINGVDYYRLMQGFHAATLEVCGEFQGIAVPAASDVAWEDADFYDFLHNTPQGARKLGRYLHGALKPYF